MTTKPTELPIYLEHLRALPFVQNAVVRSAKLAEGKAVQLEVTARRRKHAFDVALLRTHLSRTEAERWIGRAKSPQQKHPLLLLAPYVSRPMGARLREAGVQYLDQVGNMHLALSQKGSNEGAFVALVEGKRPAPVNRSESAWRAPSYQVLCALLADPALLGAPVRIISTQAGVSTSPVLQVQTKLLQHRFAIRRGRTWQWTPRGWSDARDFWLHGYHATLRPHLLVGRFRPRTSLDPEQLEKQVERSLKDHAFRWGGAAATHRLDPYYRGDRTVVHVEGERLTVASLASALRMIPDLEGPIVVLHVPGPSALRSPDSSTVHPLLAWAELLEEGHDRASEAAERFASKYLKAPS